MDTIGRTHVVFVHRSDGDKAGDLIRFSSAQCGCAALCCDVHEADRTWLFLVSWPLEFACAK